ncbi:MAG: biosynthetic arginine decarboxylase [Spirochaetaceae bacterium]|nr:biosynthetic arginine decarboxylase [Myxococcales bacterium]MCB9724346.1 biosynthetic arginine decarboxylase [Spirochaetaceae bacterium]
MSEWSPERSAELYQVDAWSASFFSVSANGTLQVHPRRNGDEKIDVPQLVEELSRRGLRHPILIRFSDILATRIETLANCFAEAIRVQEYPARWRGVYPIKVNQQAHVVEEIVEYGAPFGVGLEAGSKPELLIALALLETPDALLICNGYKDRAYIETALLAQRLGRTPVIVIDRFSEIDIVIKVSSALGIKPHVGLRARLSTVGAGRWIESSGEHSKFGLSADELVRAVDRLRAADMLDCIELLHFHIGSQITSIRAHKDALREAMRIYVGLHNLGATSLHLLDVGGGLGVDYVGAGTDDPSSMNYTEQEYANDVVFAAQQACDEAGIAPPDIITESGRAMVAHHSMLVFDVIGVNRDQSPGKLENCVEDDHAVLHSMREAVEEIAPDNLSERYHDLVHGRDEAASLFSLGYLDLHGRAKSERLFHAGCLRIGGILEQMGESVEEFEDLGKLLTDTYFGNFSLFQSLPDSWAVTQVFPIMPIHRLEERPTRRAVIVDLTCDSDGRIDHFIGVGEDRPTIDLHAWNGQPYYVGIFLVGAYQEILGDLHNLFGDTDAVHVRLDPERGYAVEHLVEGDAISDVLSYVEYDRRALSEKVRRTLEKALREGRISIEDSARLRKNYDEGLAGYTYLGGND